MQKKRQRRSALRPDRYRQSAQITNTMRKLISVLMVIIAIASFLSGCGVSEGKGNSPGEAKGGISFEAYVKEGDTFTFELDPENAVSYQDLRDATSRIHMNGGNWASYFEVKEVYREHYEYDDDGQPTETYMKGYFVAAVLLDSYYFADNWSRNGLEFQVFLDATQTRVMKNEGKTYDPVTDEILEVRTYHGADPILVFTDFVDSWDEMTVETFTGKLNSFEMVKAEGDLYLLDSSAVQFKNLGNGIRYFAAYDSDEEYYVILLKTDDEEIDPDKEYDGAVYTTRYGETYRYTGYKKIVLWEMITDLMQRVDKTA